MGACICMHTCSCDKMLQLPFALALPITFIMLIILCMQSSLYVAVEGMGINHGTFANPPIRKTLTMSNDVNASKDDHIINAHSINLSINANNSSTTVYYGYKASDDTTHTYANNNNYTFCRCMPDLPCWPSQDEWDELNTTLGGQLVMPSPPAAPCYNGPTLNITACRNAAANWMNPFWRADQVGAMQYSNKEAHGNQSCSLLSSPIINSFAFNASNATLPQSPPTSTSSPSTSSQCQQGSVPAYAVEVLDSSHVQTAVSFASQHNLRLSIKSTGHDALGRSTAAGSLNLWMHRMKNITFQDAFNPTGCDEDVIFPAVTVESGTQWGELYAAAEAKNLVVVGAMSASVSTGGGYLQGGGHSPLSPFLGMAADNVVEMKVVTADGRLMTANGCQNRDLFWALRGGGGGTFGVVISSTHIAYPPLLNVVNVYFTATSSNGSLFEKLLAEFVYLQSSLSEDNFWAGYSYITSNPKPSLTINYLVPNCNTSIAKESFQSLLNFTSNYPDDIVVNLTINTFPSFGTWHNQVLCSANPGICSDPSGLNTVLASRLLPQNVLQGQAPQVAQAFMKILSSGVGQIVGHLVGGQGVAAGQNLAGQDRLNLLTKLAQNYMSGQDNQDWAQDSHVPSNQHLISSNIDVAGQDTHEDVLSDHHLTSNNVVSGQGMPASHHDSVSPGQQPRYSNNVAGSNNDKDISSGTHVTPGNNVAGQDVLSGGQVTLGNNLVGHVTLSDQHVSSGNNVAGQGNKKDVTSGQDGVSVEDVVDLQRPDRSLGFAKDVLREYASASGATDAQNGTNSVNPAFRAALWHVVLVNAWGEGGESMVGSQTLTQMNGLLRELSPGSGCYLNEADVNEPNWQGAFYGQHYNRLRDIKERVDPEGLFTCTNCVGSELWTTNARLLCRRPTM